MTFETYEKAQELRSKINHSADIRDVLLNSIGRYLTVYTEEKVPIDEVAISEEDRDLIYRLVAVLDEDRRDLQEEFKKL